VDKSPIIAGIWRYLIATPADEIRALADIPEGGTVEDIDAPQEARWLAGFWCNEGAVTPCKTPSKWARRCNPMRGWGADVRRRIADQVEHIRHWQIIEGEYYDAPDVRATWHIDPPYSTPAGAYYPHQPADFRSLGEWCRGRRGQVMVCEQAGADWLPFEPLGTFNTASLEGRRSNEVIWTRD